MKARRNKEHILNGSLGEVLREMHPQWSGAVQQVPTEIPLSTPRAQWPGRDVVMVEQTGILSEAAGLSPDIIINHPGGAPVAVETEYLPAPTVETDARARLGKTLADGGKVIEQVFAVRIPANLRTLPQHLIGSAIKDGGALFEYCIFRGDPDAPERWPQEGWIAGTVDDLASSIELAAYSRQAVAQGMDVLETAVSQATHLLREYCLDKPDVFDKLARYLRQPDSQQTGRMAMAIIANALTFHNAIAGSHGIPSLDEIKRQPRFTFQIRILDQWHHVVTTINYWPIFKIASDILLPIPDRAAQVVLDRLYGAASKLRRLGATTQHDLSGRMFQRLIADRKFLATFYTLPSSAALLADLAVARLAVADWSDAARITSLRVADFACGTGALLSAAYRAIASRHRRTGCDDGAIHHLMMEQTLVGADIMPAATHLTASALSSAHPAKVFANTSIVTLPYGPQPDASGRPIALGALDLIRNEETLPLFGTGEERVRAREADDAGRVGLPHGAFDIVIMNPPFTRNTGQEAEKRGMAAPAFAGFGQTDADQRLMSKTLSRLRARAAVGHGNAGIASDFVDLAHAKVKIGGTIALVLPFTFAQGKAWSKARRLLATHYEDVTVVSIVAAGKTDRAFSSDTGMAEVLVVATRNNAASKAGSAHGTGDALFVNLAKRPASVLEAVTTAQAVRRAPTDRDYGPIALGGEDRVGFFVRAPVSETGFVGGVRKAGLAKAVRGLMSGRLALPKRASAERLPLTRLSQLGDRGLYHMDINGTEINKSSGLPRGPFDVSRSYEYDDTWPVLWWHDANRERSMTVDPDSAGRVRPECDARAVAAWDKTASRLHFNRDFQVNAQSLAACMTPDLAIGGHAWPNFVCTEPTWEAPLVIWANTTLGLIAFWWLGTRQQEGRVRVSITKLPGLIALDPRQLSPDQIGEAWNIFNEFEHVAFKPANEAWQDDARKELDRAVLVRLLGLPEDIEDDLALLRRQWCAEPSVHGGKPTRPPAAPSRR